MGEETLPLKLRDKKELTPLELEIKQVSVNSPVKEKKRASKEVVKVDESLLRFGTEVHALLEGLDLSKKDTIYIKDSKFRRIANNVINSELFKGITNEQVRHEFSYYDKENNVNGIIDCLIIKEDEIDIVDFKLKNIAEEDYDKQLRTYKSYVSSISNKPIKMYLYFSFHQRQLSYQFLVYFSRHICYSFIYKNIDSIVILFSNRNGNIHTVL